METIISRTAIDNQLCRLEQECQKSEDQTAIWVYYAISRYILTSRAPVEFLRVFINCNPRRFPTLIKRCRNAADNSDQGMIQTTKKFLKIGE